jgi:predicted nucleic acid-binding protein
MRAILDSGPLIALWNLEPDHRSWVAGIFNRFVGPYYVTEPVLTEVAHLTGRDRLIVEALKSGKFLVREGLLDQLDDLDRLFQKFPHCDLADASVIALSERYRRMSVLSLDRRHFLSYRRADGSPVPVVLPDA